MSFGRTLYSAVESPTHPYLSTFYATQGIDETRFNSMRKLISSIKKDPPDFIAAEFFYGYGNNYAGINISNLDVMLYSLQRYSQDTRVIVFVDKKERQYVDKLNDIMPLHAVLTLPLVQNELVDALTNKN